MPRINRPLLAALASGAILLAGCGGGQGGGGQGADTEAQIGQDEVDPLSAEADSQSEDSSEQNPGTPSTTTSATAAPSDGDTTTTADADAAATTVTSATAAEASTESSSEKDPDSEQDSGSEQDPGSDPSSDSDQDPDSGPGSTDPETEAESDTGWPPRIPAGPSSCIGFEDMYEFPMDAIAIPKSDLPSWSTEGWYARVEESGGDLEFFVFNLDGATIDTSNLPDGVSVSPDGIISVEATIGPASGTKLTFTFLPGETTVNSALPGHASACTR